MTYMYEVIIEYIAEQLFFRPLVIFLLSVGAIIVIMCLQDIIFPAKEVKNKDKKENK